MTDTVRIQSLALDANVFGALTTIHPVLIWDDAGATLVDTGYPGQFAQIRQA